MLERTPVSGTDHRIRGGGYEARIASVGATLRALTKNGTDIVGCFPVDELRPGMSGALLAPWPNRTADGTYEFDGVEHRLPLNEPEIRNAAHGLVSWLDFDVLRGSLDSLVLRGRLAPQPGYPWRLCVEVAFELTAAGLTQEVTITNEGATAAPVGLGGHPYLLAAPAARGGVDAWTLEVPADEVLLVDDVRMLPVASVPLEDRAELDFRTARPLGATAINNAYTRLRRDEDGTARVRVATDAGGVEVAFDERCTWVQVYTSDAGEGPSYRSAIAVEPMTCPPDALNSKRDLAVVEPGRALSAGWTIRAL